MLIPGIEITYLFQHYILPIVLLKSNADDIQVISPWCCPPHPHPPISEMEGHLQNSPKLGNPIDGDDAKYVSGLSAILVAKIQEAKDRISQIEYIFCSQLFPNFQSKSKSLQKIYSEAMKAAEEAYKEKERISDSKLKDFNLKSNNALKRTSLSSLRWKSHQRSRKRR